MKVLVTAFKPFNKSQNNYSEEVIKYINNVDKKVLDVIYDECYEILKTSFDLDNYDLIIALGEARSRKVITLETQAKNVASCSLKDNKGILKLDEKINSNGKEIIKTEVDITKFEHIIEYSNDAGKFVCNNIYYHLLSSYPKKSLFIHIPECDNKSENYISNAKVIEKIIKIYGR